MRACRTTRRSLPFAGRESKGGGANVTPADLGAYFPLTLPSPPQGGRGFSRRFVLTALICAPSLSFAAPKSTPLPKPSPLITVQAVYAALPRPTPPDLLSRRLRVLVRKDENRRVHNLDFEWRSGGQDSPAISGFRLHLASLKGDAATVEASFYNRGERRFRRFFLVREGARWVVDDALLVPENGKLQDFLKGKG